MTHAYLTSRKIIRTQGLRSIFETHYARTAYGVSGWDQAFVGVMW